MKYKDLRYVLPLRFWVLFRRLFFRKKLSKQINLIYEGKHGLAKIAYSDISNSLLIHIPKTAGTSICKSFFGFYPRAHFSPREFCEIFGFTRYRNLFKFTFVRNPWDRFYSAYTFLQKRMATDHLNKWADENIFQNEDINEFILRNENNHKLFENIMFRPQYLFVKDKNRIMIDYLCYFEELENHLQFICNKTGVFFLKPEKLNKSNTMSYREIYNQEAIKIISVMYRIDIELFNYDFMNTNIPKQPLCLTTLK